MPPTDGPVSRACPVPCWRGAQRGRFPSRTGVAVTQQVSRRSQLSRRVRSPLLARPEEQVGAALRWAGRAAGAWSARCSPGCSCRSDGPGTRQPGRSVPGTAGRRTLPIPSDLSTASGRRVVPPCVCAACGPGAVSGDVAPSATSTRLNRPPVLAYVSHPEPYTLSTQRSDQKRQKEPVVVANMYRYVIP